jgi:hypothetical protein
VSCQRRFARSRYNMPKPGNLRFVEDLLRCVKNRLR